MIKIFANIYKNLVRHTYVCIDIVNTYCYNLKYQEKVCLVRFEWSDEKNQLNIKKHGISFEEAKEVFLDPMHISKLDHRFDYFEERWITLGVTSEDKILVVANMFFDDDGNEIIRIISARKANQNERVFYEQH
ncbi:MAG: hypothetical protein B7X69_04090 [Sulfurovum sp. 39-42-12]|jgi:uncharacterized DUF497 family protein|nr:MAG: hypothetical protein B7Y63_00645 [Sulfurovum sp. 35-42-20]OYZ25734.1 MAG: hypothetical protein B7Y23_04265 [Sulfurovum sp. 16-42-52]OYZ50278.1 MAG: hypothetical protein B7Y13_01580 [Sulfurovum sp. 24-42-9]OZA45103.1 MAG: hypothetical protein B7X80_05940 [Sulfurovum sp. 17-42-90]OZA60365.1 MAG: hypothetical protein B7X69_04090 [Sulfurovum sp. 39-42-12]